MENLEEKWQQLKLTNTELHEICIEEEFVMEKSKKSLNSLVGKLHSERIVCKEVLQNMMVKVWRTSKPFIFIDICPNIFVIKFENQSDNQSATWLSVALRFSPFFSEIV